MGSVHALDKKCVLYEEMKKKKSVHERRRCVGFIRTFLLLAL